MIIKFKNFLNLFLGKFSLNFLLFWIIIYCCGCGHDSSICAPVHYQFSSSEINVIPYSDTSRIFFLNILTNDTIVFIGHGWDSSTYKKTEYWDNCNRDYFLPRKYINFISSKVLDTLKISLIANLDDLSGLFVSYKDQEFSIKISRYGIFADSSFIIQGKIYDHSTKFKNVFHPQFITSNYCFYNATMGILKIELSSGNLEFIKLIK